MRFTALQKDIALRVGAGLAVVVAFLVYRFLSTGALKSITTVAWAWSSFGLAAFLVCLLWAGVGYWRAALWSAAAYPAAILVAELLAGPVYAIQLDRYTAAAAKPGFTGDAPTHWGGVAALALFAYLTLAGAYADRREQENQAAIAAEEAARQPPTRP